MTDQRIDPRRRWPWLLSNAGILTVTVIVAGLGVTALVEMLLLAGGAPDTERAKLQIEALKYGLGFSAAAGAVAALLLAVRRQLLAERSHDLALQAQAHTETDAAERRVTDLYTKAVEQLGSADAAVRLGGLYALERVAQNNPAQRQTIVNVFCAYLRMPYTSPADATPATAGPVTELPLPRTEPTANRDPRQELQVRLTAQRILAAHLTLPTDVASEQASTLTPTAAQPFWYGLDLDLTGAQLINWTLPRGYLRHADFTGATFTGDARFSEAIFAGDAVFGEAIFADLARFDRATFTGDARFSEAIFAGDAVFGEAIFADLARFDRATFTGDTSFSEATFFGYQMMTGAWVALREGRQDVWPQGWRIALGPTDGWCELVYETPGTPD
jgi:hypothetical protein